MSVNIKDIQFYLDNNADLIPVHPWNKKKKGQARGKTPVDFDWTSKDYSATQITSAISKGYNLGYRIGEDEIIIDIDPRNILGFSNEEWDDELELGASGYDFEKVVDLINQLSEDLGYFDFEEIEETLPVVMTGGGGWHIYYRLPENVDHKLLKETIEEYPGVEFKRRGRQVLCAGSRHPSGRYYRWINRAESKILPNNFTEKIKRDEKSKNKDANQASSGLLTATQLQEFILDNLNPEDYSTNDSWFPLLCASHHVTRGAGVEEFVEWSLRDPKYQNQENAIRSRWESLYEKENSITIGTLVRELEQKGEDTTNLKSVLAFSNLPSIASDDEETEEADMMSKMREAANDIDINEMYSIPEYEEAGVEGTAIQTANVLGSTSSQEEIMKCLRLIKAAHAIEREQAIEILVKNKVLQKGAINKLLKDLDAKIIDDLALLVAHKTLEKTFNNGKHLTVPPNGQLWAFHKTHWKPMSDEFLGKLVQKMITQLKAKMSFEMQEVSLIMQSVKLARIEVATLNDRIHSTELPLPVINCKNGELWLEKDGTHVLKPHNYRSYLLNCLNVNYNPSSECPLFMQTLNEIFSKFEDKDDIIRHLGEMMGYMIQPYKNIASWWLFKGPGGDGKSTLVKILGGILQDAQLSTTIKLLSAGHDGGNNHAFSSLVGKLNVVIEEIPVNYVLKDTGVKILSENTRMEANPKGRDAYQFMYAGSLLMCTNRFPLTRDLSHGMMRRANIIPFNRQFTKEGIEDIDRVTDILSNPEEMAGVLNFMIEGLLRLRTRGRFLEPHSCKEAKKQWMEDGNNILRFISERIEKIDDANLRLDSGMNVFTAYCEWCQENGIKPKGRNTFLSDLNESGLFLRKISNKTNVYGGRWLDSGIEEFDDFNEGEDLDDFNDEDEL